MAWADYVDKWVLDYRLQMSQKVKCLHHTNLKPRMSDPDWARGFRYGRNHLTDEELTKVLAEFGF